MNERIVVDGDITFELQAELDGELSIETQYDGELCFINIQN